MKSRFKKSVSLLLVIMMCFCFVSCSGTNASQSSKITQSSQTNISEIQKDSESFSKKSENKEENIKNSEKSAEKAESTKSSGKAEKTQSGKGETPSKEITSKSEGLSTENTKGNSETKRETTASQKVSTTASSQKNICYLTIECKSILSNMDNLKSGHSSYVPKDGYILKNYSCAIKSGDTVYNILSRSCSQNKIKLTAQKSVYGIYISGINNIDEFDCGRESGWMYSVNSVKPGVSCDKTAVKQNDRIEFTYVCEYK